MKKPPVKKSKSSAPSHSGLTSELVPSPKITLGHETQRLFFERLIQSNRLPSTMLLTGPGGVGKKRIAQDIARTLFCDTKSWAGCSHCASCKLYQANNLPDLYQLDFGNDHQASIESVRELLYSLQLKSFAGVSRVVIFDNAHLMSIAVTNVLLKTLEEPRPNTYFILISSSKARMLPTLLSRSQVVHFSQLKRDELVQILDDTPGLISDTITTAERDLLIALADGSLEGLSAMSAELPLAQNISERIDEILDGNSVTVIKLAHEIGKDKEKLPQMLRLVTVLLRAKLYSEQDIRKKHLLACALQNAVACERLALERNLSGHYLMTTLFSQLSIRSDSIEPLMIENIVP